MASVGFRVRIRVGVRVRVGVKVRVRVGFRVKVRVLTGSSQKEKPGLPTAQGEAMYCSIEPNLKNLKEIIEKEPKLALLVVHSFVTGLRWPIS